MLNETRKDFNAVLNARKDMPKIQIILLIILKVAIQLLVPQILQATLLL